MPEERKSREEREWQVPLPGARIAGSTRTGLGDDTRKVGETGTGVHRAAQVPLVCIHGFGGARRDWDGLAAALPARRTLIRYDMRGFGASQADFETPYSHADDLLAVLDALALERIDLCGMSLGGATALDFALSHPERVNRLVLVSPLMVGWHWSEDWIARWKAIGAAARGGDMEQARKLWWEHPLFEATRESPSAQTLHDGIAAYHGRHWVTDPQRRAAPDAERLDRLENPTLLLTGTRDIADFQLIAGAIAAAAPQVTRCEYAGAGHMLNLELPERIAGDIERFLES